MTTVYQRKQAKLNDEFIDACQNGDLEKNKYITNYLNFSDNELVESMFKARDLNKKLNKDLTASLSVSKNKI